MSCVNVLLSRRCHSLLCTIYFNNAITHDSFAVACSSLLVLAAEEQSVPLLFELLRGGTLLGAAGHLLHRLRGARLALFPYPVPRLFGWLTDRFKKAPSLLDSTN